MKISARRVLASCFATTLAFLAGGAAPAAAGDPVPGVTLHTAPATVTFGQVVRFSGQITPPSAGQAVAIVDGHGDTMAHATTDAEGKYGAQARPERNARVHAQWGAAASDPVQVRVRPRLNARRGDVRLFDTTGVTGSIVPWHVGDPLTITLFREGSVALRTTVKIHPKGRFSARVPIEQPGSHRVVVSFHDGDHAGVAWRSKAERTPLPTLHEGSNGLFVRLLERRLAELHYRVYAQDDAFDYRDADAVMAFRKVQGMARTNVVDDATWRALASPKVLKVLGPKSGSHWEVNLTKQVLYLVEDGEPSAIIHISSGKPSTPTYPGAFRVWTKQAGTNSKGMYYSSFFDGNRALHGYPEVPPYAASHGCVRMPFWTAIWVYDRAPIDMAVLVHY